MTGKRRTAHVETLTAEVRTLVVGSRQVTLSVLQQLDTVHPVAIDAMGRVRPRDASSDTVQVVGANRRTGELIRSWLPTRVSWAATGRVACYSPGEPICTPDCRCDADSFMHPKGSEDCAGCGGNGYFRGGTDHLYGDGMPVRCDVCKPEPALYDVWTHLPLLVLAGLR
jgi:hypothetical protein